jgi:hypothetical protein
VARLFQGVESGGGIDAEHGGEVFHRRLHGAKGFRDWRWLGFLRALGFMLVAHAGLRGAQGFRPSLLSSSLAEPWPKLK